MLGDGGVLNNSRDDDGRRLGLVDGRGIGLVDDDGSGDITVLDVIVTIEEYYSK